MAVHKMTGPKTIEFPVSPPGLAGMAKLGRDLDELVARGSIKSWSPGRPANREKTLFTVTFEDEDQAMLAKMGLP